MGPTLHIPCMYTCIVTKFSDYTVENEELVQVVCTAQDFDALNAMGPMFNDDDFPIV